jgi:hypothetical protein
MIVRHEIDSWHLRDNLLGDPSLRDLFVYLSPSSEEWLAQVLVMRK